MSSFNIHITSFTELSEEDIFRYESYANRVFNSLKYEEFTYSTEDYDSITIVVEPTKNIISYDLREGNLCTTITDEDGYEIRMNCNYHTLEQPIQDVLSELKITYCDEFKIGNYRVNGSDLIDAINDQIQEAIFCDQIERFDVKEDRIIFTYYGAARINNHILSEIYCVMNKQDIGSCLLDWIDDYNN